MSSNRERQLAELVLLQSMYPDEFRWQTQDAAEPIPDDLLNTDPAVTLKITTGQNEASYTLELTLPESYPADGLPEAYLHCEPAVPTATRKAARQHLKSILADLESGVEVLDVLLTGLTAALSDLGGLQSTPGTDQRDSDRSTFEADNPTIRRQLFWAHHLLATSKRRDIVSWSRELRLSGWSRPGHPGAVLVEGSTPEVGEFERRIKALRWQALQVRGEDDGIKREFGEGGGLHEVEELSDIVKALRAINDGMAEWFLKGMKIGH